MIFKIAAGKMETIIFLRTQVITIMSDLTSDCLNIVAVSLVVSHTSSPQILNRRASRVFTFHLTNRTSVCTALSQCGAAFCASDVDVNGSEEFEGGGRT